METIDKIKEPLKEDFVRYDRFMYDALRSDSAFVEEIMEYILSSRGKGVRPMLVMLMAGIHSAAGLLDKRGYLSAMLVEMIHTASLVHDDIVDDADIRHGRPSVNRKWNMRISVLVGDYILARAFSSGMESGHIDIVSYITSSVSSMAEGELIQHDANCKGEVTRETYLDIIYRKTATLLGVSSGVGALSAGAKSGEVALARQFGESLGMAFQIKDDILDYAPEGQTGKPFCADLREKKITLPLLSILEKSDPLQRKLLLGRIACADTDPEQVNHLRDLVIREGGIAEAERVMYDYLDKARSIADGYPASAYRESLRLLCDYVGIREI